VSFLISVHSKWTYIKIGTIQRRLAWPLRKDDTQIREAFQIFCKFFKDFGIPCKHEMPPKIIPDTQLGQEIFILSLE